MTDTGEMGTMNIVSHRHKFHASGNKSDNDFNERKPPKIYFQDRRKRFQKKKSISKFKLVKFHLDTGILLSLIYFYVWKPRD